MAHRPSTRRSLLDSGVLSRLARMPLQTHAPVLGAVTGMHRSATRGSSVEFAEYRKYVAGDDIRHIDWQAYARSDRFYIKEFEADTNLRCYLVLDCSGSMAYEAAHGRRFDYGRSLAAHLAYLLLQQGDAAGLHLCGEGCSLDLPARQAPSHLQTLLQLLEEAAPAGGSTLVPALHALAERVQRRAMVVVLSDCLVPAADLLDAFQHLRFQRHDVAVFHLVDPSETAFAFDRPMRFVDLEGGEDLVADPSVIQASYLHALQEHFQTLRLGCREFRIDYRTAAADKPFEQALSSFLLARQGKHRAGGRR